MATTYRHTPEMGEISGFGNSYEEGCQVMLEAGCLWLEDRRKHDVQVDDLRMRTLKNTFGIIIPESPDAKALEQHIVVTCNEKMKNSPTGSMVHAVLLRLLFIAEHGWQKYCEEILKKE